MVIEFVAIERRQLHVNVIAVLHLVVGVWLWRFCSRIVTGPLDDCFLIKKVFINYCQAVSVVKLKAEKEAVGEKEVAILLFPLF